MDTVRTFIFEFTPVKLSELLFYQLSLYVSLADRLARELRHDAFAHFLCLSNKRIVQREITVRSLDLLIQARAWE